MPDYDIDRLGARPFEQLIVSLCARILGPGIEAFGDGPDGGREATYDGPINWSNLASTSTDSWDGYTVVQAKFHYHPGDPGRNAVWLRGQIKSELDRWVESVDSGIRSQAPKYLIFASNVRLSGTAGRGGIDRLNKYLSDRIGDPSDAVGKLGIQGFKIWHSDQINSFLDGHQSVRFAFPGLLTPGDVLARVGDNTSGASLPNFGQVMRLHAAQCLRNEHWIRFSEAGATSGQKAKLEEVGRDLPALYDMHGNQHEVQTISHLIEHADSVLRRNLVDRVERPHWVIIGGPGQGKTTLSALLAQIYRSLLLACGEMTPDVSDIALSTEQALQRMGIPKPRNLRWPMRIDLTTYAEHLAAAPDTSILSFLARSIGSRVSQPISPAELQSWLRAWPWLVVLDGLDEVSEVATRQTLMERVTDLMETADNEKADLLLVSTTRPLGYDERFDAALFSELNLQKLTPYQSQEFGTGLVEARLADDPELRTTVLQRLRDASSEPRTARLMETPLQVTIMSFIVESFGTLPPDRYGLFSLYYRTLYQREIDKRAPVSKTLNDHRSDIDYLHHYVGLELHVNAEGTNTEATMPLIRLDTIVRERLTSHGYTTRDIDIIADKIVRAATHRLVLLVPNDDRVGFEVRSLQELMAAKALTAGLENRTMRLLEITAHHPHWRNVWLLAAGRLFKEREHLHLALVSVLDKCDEVGGPLQKALPTAPMLACNVLDDGFASRAPITRRPYIERALRCLDAYPSYRHREIASSLATACTSAEDREYLFSELGTAIKRRGLRQINAYLLLRALVALKPTRLKSELVMRQNPLSPDVVRALSEWNSSRSEHRRDSGWTIFDVLVDTDNQLDFGLEDGQLSDLTAALAAFEHITVYRDDEFGDQVISVDRTRKIRLNRFVTVLKDPDTETALALILEGRNSELWPVVTTVQEALRPIVARRKIGHTVLEMIRS